MISDQEYEDWRNRQWSAMAQAIETVKTWEGAMNIAPRVLTSAEKAKDRLRHVVAQDRKACGDGSWVRRWDRVVCKIPWRAYMSKNPDVVALVKHWEYQDKARYRWQWRH
jgi:hypothetical protein